MDASADRLKLMLNDLRDSLEDLWMMVQDREAKNCIAQCVSMVDKMQGEIE